MKSVLVTTQHRGVYFGYVADDQDLAARSMGLDNARCAIYWATKGGIAELASVGPNSRSKIGSRANIISLHDITAIWECSAEATAAWEAGNADHPDS